MAPRDLRFEDGAEQHAFSVRPRFERQFERVRRRMPEVEGFTEPALFGVLGDDRRLKRDVVCNEADGHVERSQLTAPQEQLFKELFLERAVLDYLPDAAAHFARGERRKKAGVCEYRLGLVERPHEILDAQKVDGGLEATIQAYQSAATILQNWINSYNNNVTADISSYRFEVEHTPVSPTLEDTLTFVAYIYINGVDKTQELMNANNDGSGLYPTLFQWFVKGTKDDDSLMEEIQGKRSWQVSASQLSNDSIRAYFSGTVDIG